jgi:hypothetical protein
VRLVSSPELTAAEICTMANPMTDPDQVPPEVWKQMNITKERFLELRAQMEEREKRSPAVGSGAPDFALERLSADGRPAGRSERLSDHRGRPVALVFGSYT